MPNTILEKLQEKYPDAVGINDARNIAEAMACVSGTGGRGANAIADHTWPLYTLTFNLNGGSGTVAAVTSAPITPVTIPGGTGLTPAAGKEAFLGWGETNDATEFVTGQIYLEEDTTLYAIWGDIFTIAFDANGGTGTIESVTCPDGSSVELPDGTDLTPPEGKVFVGWGASSLATEAIESPYTPETDGTLYAIWEGVSVIVTVDPNGGSGTQIFDVIAGETITWPVCTLTPPEGKMFDYYFFEPEGTVTESDKLYPGVPKGYISEDTTVYAIWVDEPADPSNS